MLVSAALTMIRADTNHDTDQQVTDVQLIAWVDLEYRRVRRELSNKIPSLYLSNIAPIQVGPTFSWVIKTAVGADVDRIMRVERLVSGTGVFATYEVVQQAEQSDPEDTLELRWREEGPNIFITPVASSAGLYRFTYVPFPLPNPVVVGTLIDVPAGLEGVIINRVNARVARRLKDDDTTFEALAESIWTDQVRALRRRTGFGPVPGMRYVRGRR